MPAPGMSAWLPDRISSIEIMCPTRASFTISLQFELNT